MILFSTWLSNKELENIHRPSFLILEIQEFRCYEVESQKAGSDWKSNPGCQCSATQLRHWTTTNPHNHLYVLHRWYWMPQSHTREPLGMCRQNCVSGWLGNSVRKEPMLSVFLTLCAQSISPHDIMRWKLYCMHNTTPPPNFNPFLYLYADHHGRGNELRSERKFLYLLKGHTAKLILPVRHLRTVLKSETISLWR